MSVAEPCLVGHVQPPAAISTSSAYLFPDGSLGSYAFIASYGVPVAVAVPLAEQVDLRILNSILFRGRGLLYIVFI